MYICLQRLERLWAFTPLQTFSVFMMKGEDMNRKCNRLFTNGKHAILHASPSHDESRRNSIKDGLIQLMGDSSYRLNFDQGKKSNTTASRSILEWVKLQSLVVKCCKMMKIEPCEVSAQRVMQIYTKFANFTGLYFPHFTRFRNQTLKFY
jgi:hypothetical protein